jgi:hypothetical protein
MKLKIFVISGWASAHRAAQASRRDAPLAQDPTTLPHHVRRCIPLPTSPPPHLPTSPPLHAHPAVLASALSSLPSNAAKGPENNPGWYTRAPCPIQLQSAHASQAHAHSNSHVPPFRYHPSCLNFILTKRLPNHHGLLTQKGCSLSAAPEATSSHQPRQGPWIVHLRSHSFSLNETHSHYSKDIIYPRHLQGCSIFPLASLHAVVVAQIRPRP